MALKRAVVFCMLLCPSRIVDHDIARITKLKVGRLVLFFEKAFVDIVVRAPVLLTREVKPRAASITFDETGCVAHTTRPVLFSHFFELTNDHLTQC